MRLERGTDPDLSAMLTSLLEIDCERLRAFHEKQVTLRLQMAMEKRKEIWEKSEGDPGYASSIRDVYSPLPVIVEVSNQNLSRPTASNDDGNTPNTASYEPPEDTHQTMFTPPTNKEAVESESEDLIITPKTPCYEPSFDESIGIGSSPLLRRVPSPDKRPSKRARLLRSQTTKGQKWVTKKCQVKLIVCFVVRFKYHIIFACCLRSPMMAWSCRGIQSLTKYWHYGLSLHYLFLL